MPPEHTSNCPPGSPLLTMVAGSVASVATTVPLAVTVPSLATWQNFVPNTP